MITKRTNSNDKDFQKLVRELDIDLKIRDGEQNSFYSQFNKIDKIKYAVVAYEEDMPVGCGAIKEYSQATVKIPGIAATPAYCRTIVRYIK